MKIKLRILAIGLVALLVSWLACSPYASADLATARPSNLSAGTPSTATWSQTYGGSLGDAFNSMSPAYDGGYIAVGATSSFSASQDLWVVKLDASGSITWQNIYGGSNIEYASAVHQTTDWGYIVAGATKSYGAGNDDLWLLKLDSAGNISWQKTYGGTTTEETNARVIQTMDGGYLLAGTSATLPASGSDLWVFKLDSAGNISWQNMYDGKGEESIGGLLEQSAGHYLVSGTTRSFGSGDDDIWLLQLDNSGNFVWKYTYGHTGNDRDGPAIVPTSDGFILGGSAYSAGTGDADVWVAEFYSTGEVAWSRTYGGTGVDSLNAIVSTSDGGYIFAADSTSFGSNSNVWVVKLDSLGYITWQKTYGGTNVDSASSVFETSDGGYMITGFTESFGSGASDGWIFKIDALGNVDMCPLPTATTATVGYSSSWPTGFTMSPRMTWIAPASTTAMPATTFAIVATVPATCVTYVPLVTKPEGGISGHLNQAGSPAGGISIKLLLDNGSSDSTVATTTTDSSGYYAFIGAPSLSSGQSYSVEYLNPESNDTRLAAWTSRGISSYVSGSSVDLGTADLADIPLLAPGSGAVVALPYLFQWTRRPATTSDIYLLAVFDPIDVNPFWTTFVGYVSSAYVNRLSSDFTAGVQYAWCMAVWDATGGVGVSYYYRRITFSNTGSAVASPLNMSPGSSDLLKRLRESRPHEQ